MKIYISDYPVIDSDKKQKISIRIDHWDTYTGTETLSMIIHEFLVKYKKDIDNKIISPYSLFNKFNDEKLANKKWNEYLDHMIWAFGQIKDGYPEEDNFIIDNGKSFKLSNNGIIETGYEIDTNKSKEYYNDIQSGIDLFAKHFKDLWW